jgi:vancomycin resistance protein YoaR
MMTDGAQTTPAATSSATTEAQATAPGANVDATQQTSTEQADATAEANTDEAAAAPEKVVPEKYEFTQPEGVSMDAEALGEFEGLAKELKLSQEEAQKVTDIGAKLAQKWEAKQADVIQQAAAEWAASATADKEYGGEKLTESLATAKKALDAFGTPELRTLLNDSRLGNHPEVIRFMVRAGKAISEDRMVTGGAGPATATQSTARALYPNQS